MKRHDYVLRRELVINGRRYPAGTEFAIETPDTMPPEHAIANMYRGTIQHVRGTLIPDETDPPAPQASANAVKLAAESGIDLATITPAGDSITVTDVRAAIEARASGDGNQDPPGNDE